jgi:hypothetical protein
VTADAVVTVRQTRHLAEETSTAVLLSMHPYGSTSHCVLHVDVDSFFCQVWFLKLSNCANSSRLTHHAAEEAAAAAAAYGTAANNSSCQHTGVSGNIGVQDQAAL